MGSFRQPSLDVARTCQTCGAHFTPSSPNQKYCSLSCTPHRPSGLSKRKSNAQRQARADLQPRTCPHCGATFTPYTGKQMQCSACRRKKDPRCTRASRYVATKMPLHGTTAACRHTRALTARIQEIENIIAALPDGDPSIPTLQAEYLTLLNQHGAPSHD